MNNRVSLLGTVVGIPVYHCTTDARDLLRFTLRIADEAGTGEAFNQECIIWGGPAIGLADCLQSGDRILVRGPLRYRQGRTSGYVHIRRYLLLGGGVARQALALADAYEHT